MSEVISPPQPGPKVTVMVVLLLVALALPFALIGLGVKSYLDQRKSGAAVQAAEPDTSALRQMVEKAADTTLPLPELPATPEIRLETTLDPDILIQRIEEYCRAARGSLFESGSDAEFHRLLMEAPADAPQILTRLAQGEALPASAGNETLTTFIVQIPRTPPQAP